MHFEQVKSATIIKFKPVRRTVMDDGNECSVPPVLRKGQKIRLNIYGRKFKICAGEDEESTIVK